MAEDIEASKIHKKSYVHYAVGYKVHAPKVMVFVPTSLLNSLPTPNIQLNTKKIVELKIGSI